MMTSRSGKLALSIAPSYILSPIFSPISSSLRCTSTSRINQGFEDPAYEAPKMAGFAEVSVRISEIKEKYVRNGVRNRVRIRVLLRL
jgi:hypothetical protein